jgi:hypothetical protein
VCDQIACKEIVNFKVVPPREINDNTARKATQLTITMSYGLGTEASGSQGERILRNYNNGDDAWLTRMFCLSNWKQERKQNMSSFSSSPERTGDVHRMQTKR